ncbi:proton-coupled amino acid transporter-like protein pathetic isoform X2 [Thrips palmi]|uniref:Proton-coupled amino acid transporter-like protein pathetic isoform X2 n=1 Tax=Thrips palmi TaxID=161013 RepID=A0A6P9AJI6_THRPL|nr:proton-coupled amino acid transporter-like protein pathetic isoform X2 [Thrips palmi]
MAPRVPPSQLPYAALEVKLKDRERETDGGSSPGLSNCDTLTHLLKASLGSGILSMPLAFKYSGLALGIVYTVIVAIICTHCAYILVKCAHALYHKTRTSAMSFADIGEISCREGPEWVRKYGKAVRATILISLFATYFGTCSVYTVIIAGNFKAVVDSYATPVELRVYIAALLIPLVLLGFVPNLKYLAPVSMVANGFMGVGLGITLYYLSINLKPMDQLVLAGTPVDIPPFLCIVIFAMEAIGVVMPLENNMKTPKNFLGLGGVLNQGMAGVTMIYILLGFLGYMAFGEETADVITLNLPNEIPAQVVKVLIGLAVFCTYGLQWFVCLEIVWDGLKERYQKKAVLAEYIVRVILVVTSVVLAIAVPTIGPFIGLIGALCFSILGIILPCFIECITFWETGLGPGKWRLWKNIIVSIFGVFVLIMGTKDSVQGILKVYAPAAANNGTMDALGVNATTFAPTTITS